MSRVVILAALLSIAWLLAGRQMTLFVDRVFPVPAVSLPVSPLRYDGGGLVIGGVPLTFASTDNLRLALRLTCDPSHRVILSWGHDSFPLGPRTSPEDPSGRPEIDFIAEPADKLTLTSRRSLLTWHPPYKINI